MSFIYALISVIIVSLISFIGVLTLGLQKEKLQRILFVLIAFATGGLFGGAFFHLLPEAIEEIGKITVVSSFILVGILLFLVIEKFLHWRHCHEPFCKDHPHTLAKMNLIGDGFHNFLDGAIIGAAFLVAPTVGFATTLAVVLHEIPQEIGDFGVLVYAGLKVKKALIYNFLSGLVAVLGVVVVFLFGEVAEAYLKYIMPIAAGGFIYIAGSDLIPEMKKEPMLKRSVVQLGGLVLGLLLMYGLLFLK